MPDLSTIKDYTDTLEDRVDDLEEYLNCTAIPSQSICQRLDLIQNYTDTLETEVNDTQNMIVDVNATLNTRFDTVDTSLVDINNSINNLLSDVSDLDSDVQALVNCTVTPNSPICTKLDNITSISLQIDSTANTILGVVNYINGTRWNNITAQDLYELLDETQENTDRIITKVRKLKSFQEEIIFLITDSFNLQTEAREQLAEGDTEAALQSLKEANMRLQEATAKLIMQAEAEAKDTETAPSPTTGMEGVTGGAIGLPSKSTSTKNLRYLHYFLTVILIMINCAGGYFYLTKKKKSKFKGIKVY